MKKHQFDEVVKKTKPKGQWIRNTILAFLFGGFISLIGQAILDIYISVFDMTSKDATGPMLVTIIAIAILLTGLGIYDKFASIAGGGSFIPISGFANAVASSAMDAKKEGPIFGIGAQIFKLAGSVLAYGIFAAYFLGLIRYVVDLIW